MSEGEDNCWAHMCVLGQLEILRIDFLQQVPVSLDRNDIDTARTVTISAGAGMDKNGLTCACSTALTANLGVGKGT